MDDKFIRTFRSLARSMLNAVRSKTSTHPSMNSKILPSIVAVVALALATVTASAQSSSSANTSTTPLPPQSAPPTLSPTNQIPLGQQLRDIIAAHRDANKAFMEQRQAALQVLRDAAPEDREALKDNLRALMRAQQQNQRDLAKSIRDAIQAARDARRTNGG